MSHHPRRLQTTAHSTHQGGEGHATGGHAVVISVHDHHPICLRDERHHTLTAAAGGHRGIHERVDGETLYIPVGMIIDEIVNPFPFPQHWVDASPLENGLVGAGGVDLEGGAAVKPAIGTTEAGALGIYHAYVVGGEGLAKGAAIIGVHRFIGHTCYPGVPFMIDATSLLSELFNLIRLCI